MVPYYAGSTVVSQAEPEDRARFIRRTYGHLALALAAFAGLEYQLLQTDIPQMMLSLIAGNRFGWLVFLGGFAIAGWLARSFAAASTSKAAQYFGLLLYVVAEAIIFLPLLFIAKNMAPDAIPTAAIMTGLLFGGLTFTALTSRRDYSFLGTFLKVGGLVALGLIICSAMFGFNLGIIFSGAMVLLACGAILYDTSRLIHDYRTDQYVGAALELFASVALLFWYILRILMSLRR